MGKMAVVYWSGTGNTEAMANLITEGAKDAGAQVDVFTPDKFNGDMVGNYSVLALGCPSMGAEVLEEMEFDPMFQDIKTKLRGKSIGLFGSYGWGDGEWMRIWESDCKEVGLNLAVDYLIVNEAPEGGNIDACREFGKALGSLVK